VLGFAYKAVNTMDSMLGYHNDRYEYFGKAAAKMDDLWNYIPSRISALMIIIAAGIGGRDYSAKRAFAIFKRDRYNHKSPNSAQTESACAGALGIRLGGDSSYFGKMVHKPYIGDDTRPIERGDIKRASRLMFLTEDISLGVLLLIGLVLVIR
jgi:adenosylcobinamide-phosphate synthase